MRNDLTGKSENPVDEKGRVSLPTIFRKPLSDESLVIVKSHDDEFPHLRLYTIEDYTEFIEKYFESSGGYMAHDIQHQRKRAALARGANPIKFDGSYRIRIEGDLREYAQITDRVKFQGVYDHVMIMSPEIDDKYEVSVPIY